MKVLLIRANRNEVDQAALATRAIEGLIDPYLQITQVDNPDGATRLLEAISDSKASWLVISSLNALEFWSRQLPDGAISAALASSPSVRVAAIGESTAQAARQLGVDDVLTPGEGTSRVLADLLAGHKAGLVLVPSGSISMRSIPNTLIPKGFSVLEEVFYSTEITKSPPLTAQSLDDHDVTHVLFRSPSAVRAFVHFHPEAPAAIRYLATGPTTAEEMAKQGLSVAAVSPDSTAESVAKTVESVPAVQR